MSVKEIKLGNFVAQIMNDDDAENPRNWDNLGKIICKGNKYNIDDEDHTVAMDECGSWEEVENEIRKEYGRDCILLPVYIYDHSQVSLSTTPFSCEWDSARLGTIVVSRWDVRKEHNVKRISPQLKEKIVNYLEGEIETYNQWLQGEVYEYTVNEVMVDDDGDTYEEHKDSCSGYYSMEYIEEEVNQILKGLVDEQNKVMGVQTELKLA